MTPIKFPNISDSSKPLPGMIRWNISNTIDNNIKYIVKKFKLFVFLYVSNPTIDNAKKAYT